MSSFWHPLSTILLADPRCYATAVVLRMLLESDRETQLVYAGDRMWPAVAHGQPFVVEPPQRRTAPPGSVVLVCPDGIPELLRVRSVTKERLRLVADADPTASCDARPDEVLGVARLPSRRPRPALTRLRRRILDTREAWLCGPDPASDPARTVLEKYDNQATFYVDSGAPDLESGLAERIRRCVPQGERFLVVGSGTGRESLALARGGWRVTGVDFAPAMVEQAKAEAARNGLEIEFLLGDVRNQDFGGASYAAVLFTYDVYSFIPRYAQRLGVLRNLRSMLQAPGHIFLSARRVRSIYDRAVLVQQWVARGGRGECGDSHTRWIATDGTLRRSYVRVFTRAQLDAEFAAAGLRLHDWQAGHGLLSPTRDDTGH